MTNSHGSLFVARLCLLAVALSIGGCALGAAGLVGPEPPQSRVVDTSAVPGSAEASRPVVGEARDAPAARAQGAPRTYHKIPVREALAEIAREGDVDIDYRDGGLDRDVTFSCPERSTWQEVLTAMAEKGRLDVWRRSERLYVVEHPPLVSASFQNADIKKAILEIAVQTETNIIIAADVEGTITLNFVDTPVVQALRTIAQTGGYVLVEEGRGWMINRVGPL